MAAKQLIRASCFECSALVVLTPRTPAGHASERLDREASEQSVPATSATSPPCCTPLPHLLCWHQYAALSVVYALPHTSTATFLILLCCYALPPTTCRPCLHPTAAAFILTTSSSLLLPIHIMRISLSLHTLSLLVLLGVLLVSLYYSPTVSADGADPVLTLGKQHYYGDDHKRGDEHKHPIDEPCKDKHDKREKCRAHYEQPHHYEDSRDKKHFHPTGFEPGDVEEDGHRTRDEHEHGKKHHKHHRREHRHEFEVQSAEEEVVGGTVIEGHRDHKQAKHHHHRQHKYDAQVEGVASVEGHRDDKHEHKHKHHDHQYKHDHTKQEDAAPTTVAAAEVVVEGHKERCKDDRYKHEDECKHERKHHFEPTGHKQDREKYCRDDKHKHEKQCRKDRHGHYFLPKFLQALMA